jgi:hypothetical protein
VMLDLDTRWIRMLSWVNVDVGLFPVVYSWPVLLGGPVLELVVKATASMDRR